MDERLLDKLLDDFVNSIPIDPKTGLRIYNPEGVMEEKIQSAETFTAEASTLGWAPGEVRTHIIHKGTRYEYARTTRTLEGEAVSWHYISGDGRTITVFND